MGESLRTLAGRGCAIVVSGHEMRAILPYADAVTWVTAGTTYDLGGVSEAMENQKFRREYLGVATDGEIRSGSRKADEGAGAVATPGTFPAGIRSPRSGS